MGSARIYLGQWYNTTGSFMHPNTAVVGTSGNVDDNDQASYVALRAEQISPLIGAQRSSFTWPTPSVVPTLPDYADVTNPILTVTARMALTEWPVEYVGVLEYEGWQFLLSGPSISTMGLFFYARDVLETVTPTGGAFGSGPYSISEALWTDIGNDALDFSANILRTDFREPPDYSSHLPNGSKSEVQVYQIDLLLSWGSANVPARLLYPRTDDLGLGVGRVYPPPNTQQAGRRFGSGAPL